MPVNASAKVSTVWVCKPDENPAFWLDVTKYCTGESGGYYTVTSQAVDEGGICHASGSLVLDVPPFDPLFDPWENPDRWAIGNSVLVHVADSSGTLRPLPINRLYIISEPLPPYPGNWSLTLELADYLTFIDSNPLPKTAATGLALPKSRKALVAAILPDADIDGDISEDELSGYEAEPAMLAVRAVGELAIGGFSALYQTSYGRMAPTRIIFTPAQRLFKHVVGQDDAGEYEPLQNPLRPSGEIEVVSEASAAAPDDSSGGGGSGGGGSGGGNGSNNPNRDEDEESEKRKYSGGSKSIEMLSESAISEEGGSGEVVGSRRSEEWRWGGAQYKQVIEESRARGLVVPEDLYEFFKSQGRSLVHFGPYKLIAGAFTQTETRQYEGSREGRLLRVEKIITRKKGEVFAELYKKITQPNQPRPNLYTLVVEREITTYSYQTSGGKDAKGQVRKIKTIRWLPKGQVAGGANDWIKPGLGGTYLSADPDTPVVAYVKIESWRKRSKDDWEYKIQEYQAGRARGGTIKAFTRLNKIKGETTTSRNGDIRPPAAERRPGKPGQKRRNSYLTKIIRGSSTFRNGSNEVSPRKRVIRINHLKNNAHAKKIAELIGRLEHCRHRGFRITTTLRDEWFSWKPLVRVDLDYNGYTYIGLVDQVTFALSGNSAIVVADCMRTGRVAAPVDDYPYPPLPALQPTDPDPIPFPEPPASEENPERFNRQAIIPAVQAITPIAIESRARVNVRMLPFGIEHTTENFTVRSKARVVVGERIAFNSRARVEIEQVPKLEARARARVVITEQTTEPGLVARWDLDTADWLDSVGNNDLTEVVYEGNDVVLGYDGMDYYAEFLNPFSDECHLQCDGADLSILTESGNWSWRIVFDCQNIDSYETIIELENQLRIETGEGATLALYLPASQVGSAAAAFTLYSSSEWYTIDLRFDASTNMTSIFVNGISEDGKLVDVPAYRAPGVFRVGPEINNGAKIKKIKFYKTALVPRSI